MMSSTVCDKKCISICSNQYQYHAARESASRPPSTRSTQLAPQRLTVYANGQLGTSDDRTRTRTCAS